MVRVRNFISVFCLCLTLALSACFAQGLDTKEDTQNLSHYIVAGYRAGLGDLDGAVAEYLKALKTDPGSYLLHLNLASVYICLLYTSDAADE